jgi:hypothetical protein
VRSLVSAYSFSLRDFQKTEMFSCQLLVTEKFATEPSRTTDASARTRHVPGANVSSGRGPSRRIPLASVVLVALTLLAAASEAMDQRTDRHEENSTTQVVMTVVPEMTTPAMDHLRRGRSSPERGQNLSHKGFCLLIE